MSPVELVLSRLPTPAKRSARGWMARCPAHEDRQPSLSITVGDAGRALLRCHAGCTTEAIVAALGLSMCDLMTDSSGETRRAEQKARAPLMYPTAADAMSELRRQHGQPSRKWTYRDAAGEPVGMVARWDLPDGRKDIRPIARSGAGWICGGMPAPRPLYCLPDLLGDTSARVYVVEGEKAADAARSIGLLSTTSPHGSQSAGKADWSPLAGRDVVILPDADTAGKKYTEDVAALVAKLSPPATVRVVELPGLPAGGDIVEFIAARRPAEDATIRAEVEALADAAAVVEPETDAPPPPLRWEPFPLTELPRPIARFVRETAAAIGCDPAHVAMPALAVLASAIGTTRAVAPKSSWTEPAVLWAAVVARSGTQKSPAYDAAVEPLRGAQVEALQQYDRDREAHETAVLEHERDLAAWRKMRSSEQPPAKPPPPTATRYVVSDATVESLAPILQRNPRGLLMMRDELAAWLRGFDQYRGGRGGDAPAWLELWRAGTLIVDRRSGGGSTIYVARAAVSVYGTIQPGVLSSTLTSEHYESGLAARLLLVHPPERRKRWSDRVPPPEVVEAYHRIVRELLALQHVEGEHGPEPICLPLSTEAREVWAAWYDQHATRIHEAARDRDAATLAKLEAYAARLALICELVDDPQALEVGADAVRRGTVLADWFGREAQRVYQRLDETPDDAGRRELLLWIARRGGSVTPRDTRQTLARYHTTADATAALDDLVERGLARWEYGPASPRGGRPSRRCVLTDRTPDTPPDQPIYDTPTTDTPRGDAENEGNGSGGIGGGPQDGGIGGRADDTHATTATRAGMPESQGIGGGADDTDTSGWGAL